ncbi:MAG: hypothetical protein IJT44_02355 [Clostridia bacterium]|nr:hypothetical protein [Clostridia bacterium]
MEIIKEKKFYSFFGKDSDHNIAVAVLENGVWLIVRDDGTAKGADGRRYVNVSREEETEPMPPDDPILIEDADPNPIPDTVLVTVGWTVDADKPIVL